MGGAANVILKPLEKLLSKIWNKIGQSRMHTLNRLQKYGLFKFKDELRLQESKIVMEMGKGENSIEPKKHCNRKSR